MNKYGFWGNALHEITDLRRPLVVSKAAKFSRWKDFKASIAELLSLQWNHLSTRAKSLSLKITVGGSVTQQAISHSIDSTDANKAAAMTDLLSAFQSSQA